jgi:hypothetical protein
VVRTFEDAALGSVCDELYALGAEFSRLMLVHCGKILRGKIDWRKLKVFETYNGVYMFLAQVGSNVMVYAIEIDPLGNLSVMVMFAGRMGVSAMAGNHSWSGTNMRELASGIVRARAYAQFT